MELKIVTYTLEIDDKKVHITCAENLRNGVEALVAIIKDVQQKRNVFKEEFILCAGWSYYFFEERDGYWQITAPDYRKDPDKDKTDDLTIPLMVQNMQAETVNTSGVAVDKTEKPVTFNDTMIVLKSALTAKNVYFNRTESEKEHDSGWYMGLMGDDKNEHDPDEYGWINTSELLKIRPMALRVLAMPVGTLAVFEGDRLTALVDGNNNALKFTVDGNEKTSVQDDAKDE